MGSAIFKEVQWSHLSRWICLTKTVRFFLKLAKKFTSAATVIKSILSVFRS